MRPIRVVVAGGGYVALYVARGLRHAIRRGEVELTVVSKTNFHIWHGFIGEMLVGRILPSQILSPGRRVFAPARLHVASIEEIDVENKVLRTRRLPDRTHVDVPYDQLIVSLGTRQNTDAYPGLAEHAFKLKTWDHCARLRNHLHATFERASVTSDPDERRAMLTFFIAGGGFSGAEVSGEIADLAHEMLRKEFKHLDESEIRVVLVHPGATILPELFGDRVDERQFGQYPKLVKYAMDHIAKLGVELRLNTRVRSVSPNLVVLDDGERIPAQTIISAVGTRPQQVVEDLPVPKSDRGRILVDAFCRVEGHEGVLWAAGDCAAVPHPKGGICPQTALWAMKAGELIAGNIQRQAKNKALRPFGFAGLGQAVSLGRHTAIGELYGVQITGTFAWLVWRSFLFYYFPSWGRRMRLLWDWLLHPFTGRDIVDMSVQDSDDFQIKRVVFEENEQVVKQGSRGNSLYLIAEGEVEIFRDVDGDGIPDIINTIGPGAYIGHDVEDGLCRHTAQTRSRVKAVQIQIDEADQLREVLDLLKEALPDRGGHGSQPLSMDMPTAQEVP